MNDAVAAGRVVGGMSARSAGERAGPGLADKRTAVVAAGNGAFTAGAAAAAAAAAGAGAVGEIDVAVGGFACGGAMPGLVVSCMDTIAAGGCG